MIGGWGNVQRGCRIVARPSRKWSAAGGGEDAVPVVAGDVEVVGGGGLLDVFGVGAADDGDDFAGVFEEPGEGEDGAGDVVGGGDFVEFGLDGFEEGFAGIFGFDFAGAEESAAQRAPGEGGDFAFDALIEGAVVEAVEAAEVDFDLVDDEGIGEGGLQAGDEGGEEIGDAEVADFAVFF